jgi:hypothetical protein
MKVLLQKEQLALANSKKSVERQLVIMKRKSFEKLSPSKKDRHNRRLGKLRAEVTIQERKCETLQASIKGEEEDV